ncbi:MAG: ATP synthase F1 subunit epsilon [Candidatus Nealsonbacteria bacterium]|nr:ATP synthase F1 subunit epsilon [Candidatus Nealsonbacteria bacterium]
MSHDMFQLSINALDKNIFEGGAESLTLPGIDGELTILKNHIPLITALKEGKLRFKTDKGISELSIRDGILEVNPDRVIVLINK